MLKYVIGGVGVVVVLAGAYYFLTIGKPVPGPQPTGEEQVVSNPTYATSTYAIEYPSDYTKDENYAYDQFGPEKLIHGVKFTIPMAIATGTNLSADTYLSVEQLPRAKNCTADIYLKQDVKAISFTENGVAYSVATSSDAATGNVYEEYVYALAGANPCTAVRYFIHYGNMGNYPSAGQPGAVQEFNRGALISAFDAIRHTLRLNGVSAPDAATTSESTMQP